MDLSQLVEALPAAASSPLAFVSYVLLVVAWAALAFRVNRNRQLLRNLEKVPKSDRLAALQLEVNGVQLAAGISPEQWVRSRIHQYIFLAFGALCLVLVVVVVVSKWESVETANLTRLIERTAPQSEHPVVDLARPIAAQIRLYAGDHVRVVGWTGSVSEVWFGNHWEQFESSREYVVWGAKGEPLVPQFRGHGEIKLSVSYTDHRNQPRDLDLPSALEGYNPAPAAE